MASILIPNAGATSEASWVSWTPTIANITVGNGTLTARYQRINKTVIWYLKFTLGSTSSMGSSALFYLPFSAATGTGGTDRQINIPTLIRDDSAATWFDGMSIQTGDVVYLNAVNTGSTYGFSPGVSATVPMTWASTDWFNVSGSYEAA